ncbi:MAG: RtcB family protein [Patescibacteria group bacterium]
MQQVISTEKIPIKVWLDEAEPGAMDQIKHIANLPFAFHHVAIMPDTHQGYGMPIGGILATEGVVIPNAVGVDIGCGMCAVKTNITDITKDKVKAILGCIRALVPVGFEHHKEKQDEMLMPRADTVSGLNNATPDITRYPVIHNEYNSALKQLGTLGGGNHFIELQKGSDGFVWIMIHSGSRNLGKKVADHYNKLAVELNEQWHTSVPKSWELAFLPLDSEEGVAYMREMQYCVDFALANRKLMMERCKQAIREVIPLHPSISNPGGLSTSDLRETSFDPMINIAHNYARLENHFGKNVLVHRKGATSARQGETGLIPGSMGSKSFVVVGKGNPESFTSCSHGAGRRLGRKDACRKLNLEEQKALMDAQGIIHGMRNQDDLEEAPGAYKPIEEVMAFQKDLVDIVVELSPLGVVKG